MRKTLSKTNFTDYNIYTQKYFEKVNAILWKNQTLKSASHRLLAQSMDREDNFHMCDFSSLFPVIIRIHSAIYRPPSSWHFAHLPSLIPCIKTDKNWREKNAILYIVDAPKHPTLKLSITLDNLCQDFIWHHITSQWNHGAGGGGSARDWWERGTERRN